MAGLPLPSLQKETKNHLFTMTRMSDRTTASLKEFCSFIPLRLTQEERALLTVLENTLNVSEYTDHVDVASNRRGLKARRILDGIMEACHIATGLVGASAQEPTLTQVVTENNEHHKLDKKKTKKKFRKGKKKAVSAVSTIPSSSWASRDPKDNAALFQTVSHFPIRI